MALNVSPSFASGKSATGGSLSNQIAGQRATRRRATPGGMMSGGMSMRPNPPMSRSFGSGAGGGGIPVARDRITGGMKINPNAAPPMSGGMFGGGARTPPMGGDMPMRVQAPPFMAAPDMPSADMGGGMVASTAPEMDYAAASERLREKMGGNTGITGGMFPRSPGRFQMY